MNAATIAVLIAKGLGVQDILDLAWELEGGRPKPRVPATPANDRPRRHSSEERRQAYARLCKRDGEKCSDCGCGVKAIWRRMGTYTSDDWVWEPTCHASYTKVHPTTNLEIDHQRPLWAGGSNEMVNLGLLCVDCHKRKTAQEAGQRRRA